MSIKINELKNFVGRPVWDSHERRWRIVQSVAYKQSEVEVSFSDYGNMELTQKIDETWLHENEFEVSD